MTYRDAIEAQAAIASGRENALRYMRKAFNGPRTAFERNDLWNMWLRLWAEAVAEVRDAQEWLQKREDAA